jgi:hypothetical protein
MYVPIIISYFVSHTAENNVNEPQLSPQFFFFKYSKTILLSLYIVNSECQFIPLHSLLSMQEKKKNTKRTRGGKWKGVWRADE